MKLGPATYERLRHAIRQTVGEVAAEQHHAKIAWGTVTTAPDPPLGPPGQPILWSGHLFDDGTSSGYPTGANMAGGAHISIETVPRGVEWNMPSGPAFEPSPYRNLLLTGTIQWTARTGAGPQTIQAHTLQSWGGSGDRTWVMDVEGADSISGIAGFSMMCFDVPRSGYISLLGTALGSPPDASISAILQAIVWP